MRRNLFKSPSRDVVLASFEKFNVGKQSYQQFPWCANVSGIGVWSDGGIIRSKNGKWLPIGGACISQVENMVLIAHTM